MSQLYVASVTLFIVIVEGEDLQQEDGPTGEPQQEDDEFLMVTDVDDGFETLEPEVSHEGRTLFFQVLG